MQYKKRLGRRTLITSGVAGGVAAVAGGGWLASRGWSVPSAQANAPRQEGPPGAQAEPAPPSAPSPEDAAALVGIQDTLNRQAAARAAVDRAAFMSTIDQRNLVWRRIQGEYFSSSEAAGARPADRYVVGRVQPKQDTYYKAWIDVVPAGGTRVALQGVWVFRPTEMGWLHSEILNEEIGPRQPKDTDHVTLSYFQWDEDVIDRIGGVVEQAYPRVVEKLGVEFRARPFTSVNPTYGAHSLLRGFGTQAAYLSETKNTLLIRSLESFGAGLTPAGESPDDRLLTAVTHELTHMVNDQIVSLAKMPEWMSEGLAEFVANNLRANSVSRALRSGKQVPLDKASDMIAFTTDPAKGYTSAEVDLAYGESAHAVFYFVERFGQDKFFDLARQFAESRRWEETFAAVTGTSWQGFQDEWLAWLRQRFNM